MQNQQEQGGVVQPKLGHVARNASIGSITTVLTIALGFFSTPALIKSLGVQQFGIYALLTSLQAYFGVFDLGIGGSLPRFLVRAQQRGDREEIRQIISFAVGFYLFIFLVLVPPIYLVTPYLVSWLKIPSVFRSSTINGVYIMFLLFFAASFSGILSGRISSFHKMYVSSIANLAGVSLSVALMIFALPLHPSITFALACVASQVLLTAFLQIVFIIMNDGWNILASPFSLDKGLARLLFGFGMWTQINSVSAVTNLEADKVIITRFIGVAAVTPYQVASRYALLTRALPNQLLGALFPFAAAKLGQKEPSEELEGLYKRGSRYLMLMTLTVAGALISTADPFIRAWVGMSIPYAQLIATGLIISYSLNNLTGLGTTIVRAQGRPELETYYGIVSAVSNIVLTIVLTRYFGLFGVVGGTIMGNIAGSIFFLRVFHRYSNIKFSEAIWTWLSPLLLSTSAATLVCLCVCSALEVMLQKNGRALQAAICVATCTVYGATLLAFLRITRFWLPSDIEVIQMAFMRAKGMVRLSKQRRGM